MDIKVLLAAAAIVIAVVSYIPYIRDIHRGKTKPHAFSWIIWALLGYIAGIAQLKGGGGVGSVVVLVTSTLCIWIAYLAYKEGSATITRSDWISFMSALLAIPLWLITKQPVLSVVMVSIIDLVGFWPTFRKSFNAPHQETLSTYYLSTLKHCLTIAALQHYNLVTVLYPASLAMTTGFFVVMLSVLRSRIGKRL